jgi:hypothetical protein
MVELYPVIGYAARSSVPEGAARGRAAVTRTTGRLRVLGSRVVDGALAVDDLDALVTQLRPAAARTEPLLVVAPGSQAARARRTLSLARAGAPGATGVVHASSLPPLARGVLLELVSALPSSFTAGQLLVACEAIERSTVTGAVLGSLTRLARPAPRMAQHLASWWPLVVFVLVMFAVALGMFGFGEASDSRGQAQKGADAAALAAAGAARDVVPLTIRTDPDSYYALTAGIEQVMQLGAGPAKGCAEAFGWAARNRTATTCRYEGRGRFHTKATSRPSAERQLVADAEATADAHLPTCTMQIVVDNVGDRHATFTCVPGPRGGTGTAIAYYLNEEYVSSSPDQVWKALFRVRLTK